MNNYEERFYRNNLNSERFQTFEFSFFETDLWVAFSGNENIVKVREVVKNAVQKYRNQLDNYILNHKEFLISFTPVSPEKNAPEIAKKMCHAAHLANTGPMAAVAGAFSEFVGIDLLNSLNINELIIENGGDIFAHIKKDITLSVYAGKSPLSEKIGIKIPPQFSPLGICTSAGTVGHSVSFGKADAVMIACKNTLLADAYATAFANKIQSVNDLPPVIEQLKTLPHIISAILIKDDKMAACGQLELDFL